MLCRLSQHMPSTGNTKRSILVRWGETESNVSCHQQALSSCLKGDLSLKSQLFLEDNSNQKCIILGLHSKESTPAPLNVHAVIYYNNQHLRDTVIRETPLWYVSRCCYYVNVTV